eukprot:15442432-Alexandrium_andersonii.AAC.1
MSSPWYALELGSTEVGIDRASNADDGRAVPFERPLLLLGAAGSSAPRPRLVRFPLATQPSPHSPCTSLHDPFRAARPGEPVPSRALPLRGALRSCPEAGRVTCA